MQFAAARGPIGRYEGERSTVSVSSEKRWQELFGRQQKR